MAYFIWRANNFKLPF